MCCRWRVASASAEVVLLNPPPPQRPVAPIFMTIPTGDRLVRIFDPTRRNAEALTFRWNGPHKRFDHHRGSGPTRTPADDPDRAVYYAAWSSDLAEAFSSCLVEVFGDTGIVDFGNLRVAIPMSTRPLQLLELRDHGAMRAGTVAAIAKCLHQHSQPWSRYFYDETTQYGVVDGLVYRNAHNDEPALMLYERAMGTLTCPADAVARLDDPGLFSTVIAVMKRNNLTF
jgi:hypothetical protein